MLNETSLILSTAFLSSPDPDSQERCTIYGHFSKSAMKLVLYNCWRRDMYKVGTSKSLYTVCHIHFPIQGHFHSALGMLTLHLSSHQGIHWSLDRRTHGTEVCRNVYTAAMQNHILIKRQL